VLAGDGAVASPLEGGGFCFDCSAAIQGTGKAMRLNVTLDVSATPERAANPVVSSGCQVVVEYALRTARVSISLALSLALASSGICNPLQKCNLEARVGIAQRSPTPPPMLSA